MVDNVRFLCSSMQHWLALPETRTNTNAPAQPRSSWTSCRHKLAAPDLIYADKVKYPPAHPPMPWAMVATYAAPRIATSFLGVSWYRGFYALFVVLFVALMSTYTGCCREMTGDTRKQHRRLFYLRNPLFSLWLPFEKTFKT